MATATPRAVVEQQRREDQQRRESEVRQQREQAVQGTIEQMQKVRGDIEASVAKLHELSTELRAKARRTLDASSSGYIVFANSHLRFAGMIAQGLRRSGSMDRILETTKREQEEARRREEAERQAVEAREHNRLVEQLSLPTSDDFDELYGEVLSDG